jgi:hypothetical protein
MKKVRFIDSNKEQVNWGSNDDPSLVLKQGEIYTVLCTEVHSWHTNIILEEFPNLKFNHVSFEEVK